MADKTIDVNTKAESSPASTGERSNAPTDAIGSSSDLTNPNAREVKDTDTLQSFVRDSLGERAAGVEDSDTEGKEEENTDSKIESVNEEKEEGKDEEKEEPPVKEENEEGEEEETEDEEKAEDKGPVPYSRFQEVNTEKVRLATEVESYKPKVQNYDNITKFCTDNEITSDQFAEVLQIRAMMNKGDVQGALAKLTPIVEGLKIVTGDKLPPDLQERVDQGLDLDVAKEIASLRGKNKLSELTSKQKADKLEFEQRQQSQQRLQTAAKNWETTKRGANPDYKPKASEAGPDGLWEVSRDKYIALVNQTNERGEYVNPVKNETDMLALMERAYNSATATTAHLSGKKPATRKSLPSNGSSRPITNMSIEEAPTMQDAVRLALSRRR